MKILMTGHEGFIGKVLFDRLWHKGHELIGLDIKKGDDITKCSLELTDLDLIIHLAGKSGVRESVNNPGDYWTTNVEGTRRIFQRFKKVKILYASSSSAYEPTLNPYAASKFIMEQIAPPNSLGMRFHTVYSDTPRKDMFLDKLINGKLEYVTNHKRDFIHIDDLCDAIELLMDKTLNGIVDIGTGVSVKVQELAPNIPIRLNTTHERLITQANIQTLRNLGFKPKYNIEKFLTSKKLGTII